MIERKIKMLIVAHIIIIWYCFHFFGLESSIYGLVHYGLDYNPFFFLTFYAALKKLVILAGSIPIIAFSFAIAYYLYRSNKEKYHTISIMNIYFCCTFFFCLALLYIWTLYQWDDLYFFSSGYNSIWFKSFIWIPLFSIVSFLIPAMPSIFTIRYANQNKLEFYHSLFLFFGSTVLIMGFPIFLSCVGMIPYIRAIYLLGEGVSYTGFLIVIVGSLISMIIGVILAIKGAVGLSKKAIGNSNK